VLETQTFGRINLAHRLLSPPARRPLTGSQTTLGLHSPGRSSPGCPLSAQSPVRPDAHRRAFRKKSHSLPVVDAQGLFKQLNLPPPAEQPAESPPAHTPPTETEMPSEIPLVEEFSCIENQHRPSKLLPLPLPLPLPGISIETGAGQRGLRGSNQSQNQAGSRTGSSATSLSPLTPVTPLSPESLSPFRPDFPPLPLPPPVATGDRLTDRLALDQQIQIQALFVHHEETRVRSASAEAALLDDQHRNNRNSNGPSRPFSAVEPEFLDDAKVDANGNADEVLHKMGNSISLEKDLPLHREKLGVLLETETDTRPTPETALDGQTEETETGSPSETEQNSHRNSRPENSKSSAKQKSLHAKSPSLKELEDESFEAQLTEEEKRIIFV